MKSLLIFAFALSCIALSTSALVPINTCTKSCTNVRVNTICAETSDGERKTFKSKCAMKSFNCNQSTDYSYVMDGPCCAVRCSSDVYEPICAEDLNGVRRTFTSQCQLSGLICNEGIDFSYVSDGPCCAVRCADVDEPICAVSSNGEKKTFKSQCELSGLICSQGIDFTYLMDGACSKNCEMACLDVYQPVCGVNSNGDKKTFSNSCEMGRWNCDYDTDFEVDDTSCVNPRV